MAPFHIKRPGKSGHLDNLDTFCWSQGVHNTQVPLVSVLFMHILQASVVPVISTGTSFSFFIPVPVLKLVLEQTGARARTVYSGTSLNKPPN